MEKRDVTVIMTSCTSSSPADISVFEDFLDIAKWRKIPCVVVNVTCSKSDNMELLSGSGRVSGPKTKLTDPKVLQKIKKSARLLDPRTDLVAVDKNDVELH